jgi:type III pantothenate kinase
VNALLIDAGNTRLKWGVLADGVIQDTGHLFQADLADHGISTLTTRIPRDVAQVFVSNVAGPTFATRLAGVLSAHCGSEVRFARTHTEALGLRNAYRDVRQMGVDRWVAMVGAWHTWHRALVVVDAGTAVTIDAVDDAGQHLGGQIIPGVGLMASALGTATSDIPVFDLADRSTARDIEIFGDSTEAGVANGAFNAVTGAVERAISVLRSSAHDPVTVLTGGDASAMLQALAETPEYRPNLVLEGLAALLDHDQ